MSQSEWSGVMQELLSKWDDAMEGGNPWAIAALLLTFLVSLSVVVVREYFAELFRTGAERNFMSSATRPILPPE